MNITASKAIIGLIKIYRKFLSPMMGSACRYLPTCSEYCEEAIKKYGPLKGLKMGVMRVLRCHPFHSGGYDPLP